MAGRTSKAKRNIAYGMVSKALTIVLEFIARYFFIKYLGEELLGVNGVFTNVIQVLSLAELGMNNVVNYSFYEPLANNDQKKLAGLITFYKKIYNGIALTVLIVGLALTPFLKCIINLENQISEIYLIYFIFLLDTVFSYLFIYKYTILNADQKNYIYSKYEIIRNIVRTVLQIISLIAFKNIIIYLAIKTVMTLVMNGFLAHKASESYPYINNKELLPVQEKKEIISTIKSGFIYKLSAILLNSTDNILISTIVGTLAVGYLSNYVTIQTGISSFYTIIFMSLVAGIGNLLATCDNKKNLEVFETMCFLASWLGTVISVCYYVLSGEFVSLWLGDRFIMDDLTVLAKTLMLFLSCTMNPLFSFREASGLYKKTKYSILLAAIVNIILSIWWGNSWGVTGILMASVVSVITTYFWYEPFVLYKDYFQSKLSKYILNTCLYWASFLFILFFLAWISKLVVVNTWIMWIIKAFIVFFICNLYCFILFGRSKKFKYVLQNVVNKH